MDYTRHEKNRVLRFGFTHHVDVKCSRSDRRLRRRIAV